MSSAAGFRVLTGESRGAIAVIRVWGPEALKVIDAIFRPNQGPSLSHTLAGRLRLGRAGIGLGDEVVTVRIPSPTPVAELHCHGGPAAVAAVVRALTDAGATPGDGESVAPTLIADRLRAQAMDDLAFAPTLRVAEILLDQAHGALRRSLARLITEVGILTQPSVADLDDLIRAGELGVRLLGGWKVVIAGRPNVGKSQLFNALSGFERSIVNPRPGVTRDVVSIRTAFEGWPVELSDTAGERAAIEFIEEMGIRKAQKVRSEADIVLLVLDRSEPLRDIDLALLHSTTSPLVVANKCDLPPAWEAAPIGGTHSMVHAVSAETGDGLEVLMRAVGTCLVPAPPAPGAAVPFRTQHVLGLQAARRCMLAGDRAGLTFHLDQVMGADESH